jgi:SnoaL-like domain
MGNAQTAQEYFGALDRTDFDAARSMMTDDFTFSGPGPEPIDGDGFLGLTRAISVGFPDWRFRASGFQEDGDVVHLTVEVGGTHTGTLSLPFLGIPDVPATGIAARNPVEPTDLTFRAGKIANLHADVGADGGVAGILGQIGVQLPS